MTWFSRRGTYSYWGLKRSALEGYPLLFVGFGHRHVVFVLPKWCLRV